MLLLDIHPGFQSFFFFFNVLFFFFFYQSFIEASDLGTPAPSRRLLSLLILPGRGEVVVLETTDGVADGK